MLVTLVLQFMGAAGVLVATWAIGPWVLLVASLALLVLPEVLARPANEVVDVGGDPEACPEQRAHERHAWREPNGAIARCPGLSRRSARRRGRAA